MMQERNIWRSPDGLKNAKALQTNHPDVFWALGEVDALGHRMLTRAPGATTRGIDRLVGPALLRRAVTQFAGTRHLLESSSVEPAKLTARALFETLLAVRYLVHAGKKEAGIHTPSSPQARLARARFFFVAAERQTIYKKQALVDGRSAIRRVTTKGREELCHSIQEDLNRLQGHFPTQMKRFGPLRCFGPMGGRKYFDHHAWFSFGFPSGKVNTIRALAERLGRLGDYEHLYSAMSSLMHPTGIRHDGEVVDDRFELFHPHIAVAFQLLTFWTCSWQLLALGTFMQVYSPDSIDDARTVQAEVSQVLDALDKDLPVGFF